MKVNKEGYWIIIVAGVVCVAIWFTFYKLLMSNDNNALMVCGTVLLLLLWFFIVSFFREPKRVPIHDNELVFAPCDGKVVAIEKVVEKEYLQQEMIQVSIFMSLTNIHMNWLRSSFGLFLPLISVMMPASLPQFATKTSPKYS